MPAPDLFAAAAVRASKTFLVEGGENFASITGARIDASAVAEGAAAADALAGVRNVFAAFESIADRMIEEAQPDTVAAAAVLPKHEDFAMLKTAAADCEFMFSEWDPRADRTSAPRDATSALGSAARLLARTSEFCRAGGDDDALALTPRACDCVARLAAATLRASGSEELAAAFDLYTAARFEFARLSREMKKKRSGEDDVIEREWELVREIARNFVLSSSRRGIDASWRPAFRQNSSPEFAYGPTPETVARTRWRAAAFVGTVVGLSERSSSFSSDVPRLCALRIAADYPDLVAACCDCERSEFVLSILSAASTCVAIVRNPNFAVERYEQTCTRVAAIVLAGCAADRFFWGAFGGETYDFTKTSWIPPAPPRDDAAARVSGDTTDEDEEEMVRRLEAEEEEEDGGGAEEKEADDKINSTDSSSSWTRPAHRSRDRAMHWTSRVMAVVYRATELIIESLGDGNEDRPMAEAELECELDCAMLAARIASRAMGAAADFSDRIRSGCVRDLWMARRETAVRSASGKLVAAAVRRLYVLATRAAAISEEEKIEKMPESSPVADVWQSALRARSFAFGADAQRRMAEHETGRQKRKRVRRQPQSQDAEVPAENFAEKEEGDKTNLDIAADEDPRTKYWQRLRDVVFHTWLNGECDSIEWFPPDSSFSENEEGHYGENRGGVSPWLMFAAACIPATRVTISRVGNQFAKSKIENICGCWVDASDAATLATLIAASACCGAGARLLRSPSARVITEAGLMWIKRLGEEDICSRLCVAQNKQQQSPKFVRDDGALDAQMTSIGVLGVLALECGAWAAVVMRDAVSEEGHDEKNSEGPVRPDNEDSSDDDDDSASDSDRDDGQDEGRRCAERLKLLVRWNWKSAAPRGSATLAPHEIAVTCAGLAFDLAPVPEGRAWKKMQGLFGVALLGPSAAVYENESAWLERFGGIGTLGRCHGGLASAGTAGALEIARVARGGHLVFALRNAASWIRLECGWNAMAEALGMDRGTALSLLGAMRVSNASQQQQQQSATAATSVATLPAVSAASSGMFSSLFGKLRAIYHEARGPAPPGHLLRRDENALTNVLVPGEDVEAPASATSERCRRSVRRALIAVQTIIDERCGRRPRPLGRTKIDSAVRWSPANLDGRQQKFPAFLDERIAKARPVFAHFCRRIGLSAVPEIYNFLGFDGDVARADAFATRGPCELAMALGVLYARHRYSSSKEDDVGGGGIAESGNVSGDGNILVVKEPDADAISALIAAVQRIYHGSTAHCAAARTIAATIMARARLSFPLARDGESSLARLNFFAPQTSTSLPFATVAEAIFFSQLCRPLLIGDKTLGPVLTNAADVAAACACLVATLQRVRDEKTAYDVFCVVGSCASSLARQDSKSERWTLALALASFAMCAAVRLEISVMKQGIMLPADARDVRDRITDLRNCVRSILQEAKDGLVDRADVRNILQTGAKFACCAVGAAFEMALYVHTKVRLFFCETRKFSKQC